VRAFPTAIAETFLQGGQYDFDSTFGYASAVADEAGRYRLLRAEPGELHLYAGPGGRRTSMGTVPWANAVLHAQPGAAIEWNAKIDAGLTVRGVVRYRDGAPMPNVFITLSEPGSKAQRRVVVNGKDGRFRFVRLQKQPYDIAVQVWDPPSGSPPVGAREVWPDTGEIEVIAAFDAPKKRQNGSVRGTIADPAGRLTGRLSVILSKGGSWYTQSHLEGMSFRFDDVEPGTVQVIAMSGEDPVLFGPKVELHDAEQKDFGTLSTEPGGKVRLTIGREPGTEAMQPKLFLQQNGASHARSVTIAAGVNELLIDNLCTGAYELSAYEKGLAATRAKCTVVANAETPARITLRPTTQRELVVEYMAAQKIAHIRVLGANGVEEFAREGRYVQERPLRIDLALPVGRFTLRVETEGGGVAETAFAVESLAPAGAPVVVHAK
jgi:hypothetical protein